MYTAEAEYVSLSVCCAQVIWMRTQLLDYGYKYNRIPMYCDSKSVIAISCNPVQHSKTKHIDIRYHFIKEHVEKGTMEIYFVGTEYQLADLFTKALPKERFEYLVHRIVIIMAQQQHANDVHPDKLCSPNKRYDLMDANKKVDLEHVQCPPKSKILTNIIKNHPLRFSIAAFSSVPWIYMAQFWHTLKEYDSKYRLRFMLDKKELSLTLDDFRTIFHLPQGNDNNHNSFVPPPSFSDMIMQMMYCFVNNIHVDYAELLWEGIYYSLHHPTSSIPYPRFTKIIVSHYMTIFPEISRRARDMYHNLQDDDIMKNIFNSGRHKDKVGMQIPDWMITEEMKHTEHYRMYAEVFGLDVPLTQSQPTESTQGTHRTPSAPRSPTPKKDTADHKCQPVDKADEYHNKTHSHNLAEHKSQEEQEARENVELVNKHLASEEIEKMMEGSENRREKGKIVEESMSTPFPTSIRSPRIHIDLVSSDTEKLQELTVPSTKLSKTNRLLSLFKAKPARFKRYKNFFQELQGRYTYLFEHLKARFLSRKSFDTLADHLQEVMVESLPTMVDTHIKEQVKKQVPEQVRDQVLVYVAEGLIMERQKTKEEMERMIAKAILQERGNIQAEISSQIQKAIDHHIPSQVDASVRSYMSGHILHVHPAQSQTLSVPEQQYQLYLSMKNDPQLQQQDIAIWLALQMKFENLQVPQTTCRPSAVRPRDQDDPHDDAHPEGENSAKRQKTSEYEAYVSGESSSGQVNEEERDDDEIPTKQVSQDIMEEVSLTIDEAKLKKMADEMLRQRCTSGDEHQYHIDQMKNFLKSDIVWETPALSLINQDLLYLKKGSSRPEKIVLSFHKFPAIIFNDNDIEERTFRWNPHAKISTKEQKEPGENQGGVARRANECIVSIIEPDYKNLNKNDIEDMYLLILNGKYGYVQRELTNDEVEYLKLFEEDIEVRLKYRNQMRRWEMYVNGRPLGPRRERPE
ncbi:hypothetical protein Tco_0744791 [Tanacetum coccineum]